MDGTQEPLLEGDAVFEGDVLGTGPDATLSVVFIDNTVFALEENAQITVDEMIYDPASCSSPTTTTPTSRCGSTRTAAATASRTWWSCKG